MQHRVRRLMAQQRGLGQIFPAGQHHGGLAVLLRRHGLHPHTDGLLKALGQPDVHAAHGLDGLGLVVGQVHGVVPRVAVDQLAHAAVVRCGPDGGQLGGRQLLQQRRGQHRLIAVAHGGICTGGLGRDPRRTGQGAFQLGQLALHGLDLALYLLLAGVGVIALQHGGLQRRQIAVGGGIVPGGQRLPQGQDVTGDGRVQLQRRVRVQIRGQGEFQLLELQLQRLDAADGLQGAGVGIDGGHRLSCAHLLPLLQRVAHRAVLGGQRLLVADQPAVQGHHVLRLALIDQGGGQRVGEVVVDLHGEIQQHRRQHHKGQHPQPL